MKIFAVVLALSCTLVAEEHTVTVEPFIVKTALKGILVPAEAQIFSFNPKQWKDFTVGTPPVHGALVQKGEPVMIFDKEEIDRAIKELEADIETEEIRLAIANRELAELQQKNEFDLKKAKRDLDEAEADLKYHETIQIPTDKEEIAHMIQKAKDQLSYEKEELAQLLKMYQEDDLTEETEEIILVRQKANVRDAEARLKRQEVRGALKMETTLPRSQMDLEDKVTAARITYATAKLNLPRDLELKALAVKKQERDLAQKKTELTDTQADRELMIAVADFDGRVVFGGFGDGAWNQEGVKDSFEKGNAIPLRKTVLTLVKKESLFSIEALLEEEEAQELRSLLAKSEEDRAKVALADYPNLEGQHLAVFTPQPRKEGQYVGKEVEEEFIFYQKEAAIIVPQALVKTREDGTSFVLIKLAEGEPEERAVELGRKHGEGIEVLSGIEENQVILP